MNDQSEQNRRAYAARNEASKAGNDPIKLGEWLSDMRKRAEKAEARVFKLKTALLDAINWFEQYAYLHERKKTQEGNAKAAVNKARAKLLRAALAETEERAMTHEELREAVARAAYESMAAVANEYDPPWSKLPDDEKQPFRETAALFQSAIREAGYAIAPVELTVSAVPALPARPAAADAQDGQQRRDLGGGDGKRDP